MNTRITIKDLDRAVIELNSLLGYTMGQEDSFCLQGAYGGWQLQRKHGSGIEAFTNGYITTRKLFDRIADIRRGVQIERSERSSRIVGCKHLRHAADQPPPPSNLSSGK